MFRAVTWMGLLAGSLTAAGLIFCAFGPATYLYPPPGSDITGTASLWSQGAIGATFVAFFVIAAAAGVGVVLGAMVRADGGGSGILWISFLLLAVASAVTLPGGSTVVVPSSVAADIPDAVGIGIYLVPSVVLTLATIFVGMLTRPDARQQVWAGSGRS